MNDLHIHNQRIFSVTRKKWAEAVRSLRRAEAHLARKQAELTQTHADMRAVKKALESAPMLGRMRGSCLQMDAAARDGKRSRLEGLEARERELAKEISRAMSGVDDAKNEVAKVHAALKRLSS